MSYTKIQGQLQDAGNTTTLSHYLNLLGKAELLEGIDKFALNIIRKRASSPKFQVHNNALLSSQLNHTFPEIKMNPTEWGRIVESAIGAYLINQSKKDHFSIYYWRDRNDEVDFVLQSRKNIVAIEVKSTIPKSKPGMTNFQKRFNPDKIYIIDNKSLSWKEFLKINPLELF